MGQISQKDRCGQIARLAADVMYAMIYQGFGGDTSTVQQVLDDACALYDRLPTNRANGWSVQIADQHIIETELTRFVELDMEEMLTLPVALYNLYRVFAATATYLGCTDLSGEVRVRLQHTVEAERYGQRRDVN